MPNHYTNTITVIPDGARDDYDTLCDRLTVWATTDPCERVRPMPWWTGINPYDDSHGALGSWFADGAKGGAP